MKTVLLAFAGVLSITAAIAQSATSPSGATAVPGTTMAPGVSPGVPGATVTPGSTATPGTTLGAPKPGVKTGMESEQGAGIVNRNTGSAAAGGDRNQAVATTSSHAAQPAHGSNSFSMGEARRRLETNGFQDVADLKKDGDGVWRGTGKKAGQQVSVWLDYKGNVCQQ